MEYPIVEGIGYIESCTVYCQSLGLIKTIGVQPPAVNIGNRKIWLSIDPIGGCARCWVVQYAVIEHIRDVKIPIVGYRNPVRVVESCWTFMDGVGSKV